MSAVRDGQVLTTAAEPPSRPEVAEAGPWSFPTPTSERVLDNGLRVVTYDVPGQ